MKFRKKPIVIEALQFRAGIEPYDFSQDVIDGTVRYTEEGTMLIKTLEGVMQASPGDWIIRGVKGELYPCKPDIFEKSYEPASSEPEPDNESMRTLLEVIRDHGLTDSLRAEIDALIPRVSDSVGTSRFMTGGLAMTGEPNNREVRRAREDLPRVGATDSGAARGVGNDAGGPGESHRSHEGIGVEPRSGGTTPDVAHDSASGEGAPDDAAGAPARTLVGHLNDGDSSEAPVEEEACVCGHVRDEHSASGECQVEINSVGVYCPCAAFEVDHG